MDRLSEVQLKINRVVSYLENNPLDGVLLSSVANFAWLTAGGDSHVENHSKVGVASLLISKSKRFLLTNNIEADRLITEQLVDVEKYFDVVVYDWFDPEGEVKAVQKLSDGLKIASDVVKPGMPLLSADFNALRFTLTESELVRYRWLGKTTAEAFENAAKTLEPGMTEYEIEAVLSKRILEQGIMPVVVLVAGDDRNFLYRHPVPTDKKVDKFAKLVCCARKWGLITALTRSIHFGEIPDDIKNTQKAVNYVDVVFHANTKPGNVVGQVFNEAQKAYAQVGFPEEWKNHHQGGAIGYEAREYIATAESKQLINHNQAYAWNPSINGNKSEDSILITESGLEVITNTGNWPLMSFDYADKTYNRPDILII